ncbi:DUF5105 domain-containing protein [Terrilactibacillus sp. BCM23-1]|uniref:DUF5105 domain-containing protein n=1 Tax=Terrilactibacillus tamarindi TaxID=2599694 RepID=A0A6N8CP84_9BACI|nr:DUF5105 domain-containing protein [Terrilactibacillus tamarindi]MTT31400.1 DUF5105 domain-containing protein [Terrilactibacillus tamarindi]
MVKVKWLSLVGLLLVLLVSGCGQKSETSKEGEATSDIAKVSIKNGTYITSDGKENTDEDALLALNVSVTNDSKDTLYVDQADFALYDSNNEKVSDENVYDETDNFKRLDAADLPKGKSTTGFIVFRVAKDQKYELHFKPKMVEKTKDIVLKVNAKDYKDNQEEIKDALNAYIQTVFFDKENPKYKSLVSNNASQDKKQVESVFKDIATNEFGDMSQEELKHVYHEFKSANANKGSVELKIDSAFPENATVKVTPKVLLFDNMDEEIKKLGKQFVDDNKGKYSSTYEAQKAFVEYAIKHAGDVFDNTTPESTGDDYSINLKKEGDKWKIDTVKSSDNYDYEYFMKAMSGSSY